MRTFCGCAAPGTKCLLAPGEHTGGGLWVAPGVPPVYSPGVKYDVLADAETPFSIQVVPSFPWRTRMVRIQSCQSC
jgi:hypothetical protein